MAFSIVNPGQRTWSGTRDSEGHRTYKVVIRIKGTPADGPANALRCPGLFVVGATWAVDDDLDVWAWCRADASMEPVLKDEVNVFFDVEQTFSTKPPDNKKSRCQDLPIENPLLEPAKISGSVVNYTEEATIDRFGQPILYSSFEVIRGPLVEFDKNRETVKIEQNYPILALDVVAPMIDTVNQYTLWGLPPRTIKLSTASWERKFEGSCSPYYTWVYNFDIRYDTFDRDIADESAKVLSGHWDGTTGRWILNKIGGHLPDPDNPNHYIRFKDRNGENCRILLNGAGLPADVNIGTGSGTGSSGAGGPGNIHVEYYDESDFTILGIPTSL